MSQDKSLIEEIIESKFGMSSVLIFLSYLIFEAFYYGETFAWSTTGIGRGGVTKNDDPGMYWLTVIVLISTHVCVFYKFVCACRRVKGSGGIKK